MTGACGQPEHLSAIVSSVDGMSAQPVEDIDLMRRLLRNEASIAEIRAALTPEDAASLDAEARQR